MKELSNIAKTPTAKKAVAKLELLTRMKRLDIYHESDYLFCGVCLRNHKYMIYGDRNRAVLLTAIQQLHRFGSPEYIKGSRIPLLVYHLSDTPILELHFGPPQLFEFTPACMAVTLPSEVLIGTLKKHETTATAVKNSTTVIRAFDNEDQFLFTAEDSGVTAFGETLYNVIMESKPIAKIRSGSHNAALTFIGTVSVDIRALLLATAIWLEILERKRPQWKRYNNQLNNVTKQ